MVDAIARAVGVGHDSEAQHRDMFDTHVAYLIGYASEGQVSSPAAGKISSFDVGVDTHRGGSHGVTAPPGVSNEDNLKSAPEEPGWP